MERHDELAKAYTDLQNELRLFYNKNNAAAGTRARLLCVKIAQITKQIRIDIQAAKADRKTTKATA